MGFAGKKIFDEGLTGAGGKNVWPGTRTVFGTITVGKFGTSGTSGIIG
jgi:hypothetical protein